MGALRAVGRFVRWLVRARKKVAVARTLAPEIKVLERVQGYVDKYLAGAIEIEEGVGAATNFWGRVSAYRGSTGMTISHEEVVMLKETKRLYDRTIGKLG